jgi:hypothetical protein|tara:strand:- start:305 stop:577 length:273 start_codon:yes stop_codon:yes gene_type:complete
MFTGWVVVDIYLSDTLTYILLRKDLAKLMVALFLISLGLLTDVREPKPSELGPNRKFVDGKWIEDTGGKWLEDTREEPPEKEKDKPDEEA